MAGAAELLFFCPPQTTRVNSLATRK